MAIPRSVCDNCVNTECLWRAPTGGNDPPVMICPNKIDKPQTNYDRIISKTPEALAEWIALLVNCDDCPCGRAACYASCASTWLDWLRQEATE